MPRTPKRLNVDMPQELLTELWQVLIRKNMTMKSWAETVARQTLAEDGNPAYSLPIRRDSTVSPKDQRYLDLLKLVLEHGPKDLYARVVLGALDAFEKTGSVLQCVARQESG